MFTEQYYQGIEFSKKISKPEAIKISKKLDKISNPFEPTPNTNIKKILKKKFTKQYAELDLNNWRKNYG